MDPAKQQPLEPERAEQASLRQAVEWVAFGYEPLTYAYDEAYRDAEGLQNPSPERAKSIMAAQQKLFTALRQGLLAATFTQARLIAPEWRGENRHALPDELPYASGVKTLCSKTVAADTWCYGFTNWNASTTIFEVQQETGNLQAYYFATNVRVLTADLQRVFPSRAGAQATGRSPESAAYTTMYIDLIHQAVAALNISEDNQPLKKEVIGWLEDNAHPPISKNMAEAIATFVRLPEMQAGGWSNRTSSRLPNKSK